MGAVKSKSVVKLRAAGVGAGHSRTDVSVRDLTFSIDEPIERGGSNTGPTPTDTALAALIGCTNVIGHKVARNLGVDIGDLEISATCDFDRRGVTLEEDIATPFQKIELRVIASGSASPEDLQRVAVDVAKYCPLSKLFRGAGVELVEEWSTRD